MPTVVITHHASSPRYASSDVNHCYASYLEPLVEERQPDLWVHGHIYCRSDYRVGDPRVFANPRGHAAEREGFVPDAVVEV